MNIGNYMPASMKALVKKVLYNFIKLARGNSLIRSSIDRVIFDRDTFMIKFTPHGTFAFFPDEVIGKSLRAKGEYSKKFTEDVISKVQKSAGLDGDSIWLEIGANIGTQTVYAERTKCFDRFICIEPDPINVRLLEVNLKLNDMWSQTHVVQMGMGAQAGELPLLRSPWNFGGATFRGNTEASVADVTQFFGSETAPIVKMGTVDTLLEEINIELKEISLIWIDVEGFECEVIKGMKNVVQQPIPIVFEFHTERLDRSEVEYLNSIISKYKKIAYVYEDNNEPPRQVKSLLDLQGQFDILLLADPSIPLA